MYDKRIWRLLGVFSIAGALLFLVTFELSSQPKTMPALNIPARPVYAQGITLTVNTADDNWDGVCNAIHCSFREAVATANADSASHPVTITFDAPYVITVDRVSRVVERPTGPVYIDGDLNDDDTPDVTLNGENLTTAGSIGLWIRSDGVIVDGLVIRDFDCTSCWGLDIYGDNGVIVNTHLSSNTTAVLMTDDADHNTITNCVIADNSEDGVLISAKYATIESTLVVTPAHHNTIANSYIGTNVVGDDLGNADKGIVVQRGAYSNTLQNNVIAYNGCYAVYVRGGSGVSGDPFAPPYANQVLDNEIHSNGALCVPQAAVVNDRTHEPPGDMPTLSGGTDNLFAGNTITDNTGIGMYNIGASPLITDNTVANNSFDGIYNLPDFGGTYAPTQASDDILSIPIIKNNTVNDNGRYGIYSLDTAPVDRYTLHQDNTLDDNTGPEVLQVWYGAVEVLTGTVGSPEPITAGISGRVVGGGTSWMRELSAYAPAAAYSSGIWGDSGLQYTNISSWPGIREFEVEGGSMTNHLTHTVQVYLSGAYTGTVSFSFDGLTTTEAIAGDVGVPQWVATGPFGRYQVPEVNFTHDSDGDGLPDVVEGTEDSDNDGTPDYLDTDSDNDGIPDGVEGTEDPDNDGLPNYLDPDSDNDGIPDDVEAGPDPEHPVDSDGDGLPDYLDTDSDNDGIPDSDEAGPDPEHPQDSDGDGIPDYIESNTEDPDGDGTPNYQDPDSDGDGISDDDEYYGGSGDDPFCPGTTLDSDGDGIPNCRDNDADGDGIPNYVDGDSDGDGIPDAQEGTGDTDEDGVPDWLDPADGADTSGGGDSDGDTIYDATEYYAGASDSPFCSNPAGLDTDEDGILNCQDNDVDGDGIANYLDTDSDDDGTLDAHEPPPDPNAPPFRHGNVPAWIDPVRRVYLPEVVKAFTP